jgi:hypothetical protein
MKMIRELCGFCGDTVEDCADAGECNAGVVGYEDDTCAFCNGACRCDDNYSAMKEQEAADYFDYQEQ